MKRSHVLTAGVLLMAVAGAVPVSSASDLHFALSKSAPEPDANVPAPAEIRLWFTEEPQDNSISIRLLDSRGDRVETGEVTQDREEPTVFSVSIDRMLSAGSYRVAWRGIGQDGHPVRGDFAFTVTAQ